MAGMMDWGTMGTMMAGWGGMGGLGISAAVLVLVNIIAIIWAIVHVMRQRKMDAGERISWVVIVLALQLLGVIIYLFMRRKGNKSDL